MFTMLAASKMNGGRDRLHELSGIPPLSFTSKGKPLTSWSITGNTVQNGTPTPENPVEVFGCGDRTGNLFDNSLLEQGGWSAAAGTIPTKLLPDETNYTRRTRYKQIIPLLASTLSLYCPANIKINYVWIDANGISLGGSGFQKNGGTVTAPEQAVSMTFILGLDSDTECTPSDFSGINLVAGSIAPESYEPYGYKIPIVTRGKNLLGNYEIFSGYYYDSAGTPSVADKRFIRCSPINVKTGTNYVISSNLRFHSIWKFKYDQAIEKIPVDNKNVFVFNTGTDCNRIRISLQNTSGEADTSAFEWIQLEEGTTATPYEPYHEPITTPIYLDSPLYKIEGYADRLSTTEEVRIVKELVLTGNENFNIDTNLRFSIYVADIKSSTSRTGRSYCSHYECLYHAEPYDDDWNNVYYQSGGTLYFHDKRFVTVTGFKEYLAAQHAAGTPVTVWYQLAKPTTETFTAPQIPTLNGTTIIDVDTAVKPESMTIKYRR